MEKLAVKFSSRARILLKLASFGTLGVLINACSGGSDSSEESRAILLFDTYV